MSDPKNGLESLNDLSLETLSQNIKQSPFAGAYHLALAQNLTGGSLGDLTLYCNDRVQLHYKLHEKGRIPSIDDLDVDALTIKTESGTTTIQSQNDETEVVNSEIELTDLSTHNVQIDEAMKETITEEIEGNIVDHSKNESLDKEVELIDIEGHVEAGLEELKSNIESSINETKSKKKRKQDKKFKLNEYSGISDFSRWLLSFQKEDIDKKIRKEEKAAKRRAFEANAMKSVTKTPSIISEPLAEILANQGHLDDAKKMYEQLMVKYPEKSTYFAEKINHLIKV